MTATLSWAIVGICCVAIILLAVLLAADIFRRPPEAGRGGTVNVAADPGSVITVRKVGGTTRVDIRAGWAAPAVDEDPGEGLSLGPTPAEVTAISEPELYREYMSPSTSATRKYEIISYIYGIGLTLPFLPGLHEQFLREQQEGKAAAPEEDAGKKAAVRDEGATRKPRRTLHIDRKVAEIPMESMDDDPPAVLDPGGVLNGQSVTTK